MTSAVNTPQERLSNGGDQARVLRTLSARRAALNDLRRPTTRCCHSIVVSGGKGGVGRSVIALNLAITLKQRGFEVGLLDACPDLGNIDLLCGLNGYWNLSHALNGCRQLDDVVLAGPGGVNIISGASCLVSKSVNPSSMLDQLYEQLGTFESKLDWMIVDASGGTSTLTRRFFQAADDALIVTTPEATAVAEAYSSVKSMATTNHPRLGLLVNQAESAIQAERILDRLQQAAHSFLHIDLHRRGYLSKDSAIPLSVNAQVPFVIHSPDSLVTAELTKLAQRWTRPAPAAGMSSFFSRLRNQEGSPPSS